MLKEKFEGVTKHWQVARAYEPVFDGGKLEVSNGEDIMVSMFQETVHVVDWRHGKTLTKLFSSDSDASLGTNESSTNEAASCFVLNPIKSNEIAVAMKSGLLKLYDLFTHDTIRVVKAHLMPVLTMAYDPSGSLVATGSADKTIKVWDMEQGHCTHIFKDHSDIVQRIYFHPVRNDLRLFSSGDDNTVRIYDLHDSICVAAFKDHMSLPTALVVAENGHVLVTGGRDKVLNFYELRDRVHIKTALVHDSVEAVVVLSKEHSAHLLQLSNASDTTSLSTDIAANKKMRKSKKSADGTTEHLSALSQYVVMNAGESGTIHMHSISLLGKDINSFRCQLLCQIPISVVPPEIVVPSDAKTLDLMRSGQLLGKLLTAHKKNTDASDKKTKRSRDMTNSSSGTSLLSFEPTVLLRASSTNTDSVKSMQYLTHSGSLVVTTADRNILTFQINCNSSTHSDIDEVYALRLCRQLIGFNDDILDLKFIRRTESNISYFDQENVLAVEDGVETDSTVVDRIVAAKTRISQPVTDATPSSSSIGGKSAALADPVALHGPYSVALVSNSSEVRLMDHSMRSRSLVGHSDIVLSADISPDGQWLVTCSKDTTVRIWNINDQNCYGIGRGHTDAVTAVALSPNAHNYTAKQNFIVSGGNDKILKKWLLPCAVLTEIGAVSVRDWCSTESGHDDQKSRWETIQQFVNAVGGSGYYRPGVGGSTEAGAALREHHRVYPRLVTSLTAVKSVKAHEKDITSIAVSPNDRIIASGSQDKTVKLWDSESLALVASLSGHRRGVWKVVFSPVDKVLASSSGDRTIKLWSMNDHSCLRTFEGHTASVLSVAFVTRGLQLASCSADGLLRVWTIRSGECENTFDRHSDKIWAIAVPPEAYYDSVTGDNIDNRNEAEGADDDNDAGKDSEAVTTSANKDNGDVRRLLLTGGSDSRMLLWQDATREQEGERLREAEQEILLEQQMQNDIRHKRFGKALRVAISLGHSHRTLVILKSILDEPIETSTDTSDTAAITMTGVKRNSASEEEETLLTDPTNLFACAVKTIQHRNGDTDRNSALEVSGGSFDVNKLDPYVGIWRDEEVEKVVTYMRDWNTNSRNSFVCTMMMDSLMRLQGHQKLLSLRAVAECLPALVAYYERHLDRINKLHESSYLADYVVSLMVNFPTHISGLEGADGVVTAKLSKDLQAPVQGGSIGSNKKLPNIFETTEVFCIDDDAEENYASSSSSTLKVGDKRKGAATFDEPIDLTEENFPHKIFNEKDDSDDDEIEVIIPLHTLLSRFQTSISALTSPASATFLQQFHSAPQPKKKQTSKKANNYSAAWTAGVGYGGSAETGLISASKSVQQAQKKVSLEDNQAIQGFRGVHFCFTANQGVISPPFMNEVSKHRHTLLTHLERRLKNDSLMDIAGRKELYLAVLDTLQSVLDNDSLVTLFLDPPSSLKADAPTTTSSSSSSSSSSGSLLERLKNAVSSITTTATAPASNQEPEEPSLRTCNQWLRQLQQQAATFLHLQRSAGNTVDEEFMNTLEIAAHLQSTFQSLDKLLQAKDKEKSSSLDDERKPAATDTSSATSFTAGLFTFSSSSSTKDGSKGIELEKEYVTRMTPLRFHFIPLLVSTTGAQTQVPYQYRAQVAAEQRAGDRSRVSRILNDITTLSASLPIEFGSSVFVRCDEDRYDVIKALIIGPVGTPYENGCFEFDIFLPHAYPSVPPQVHLRTTGNGTVRFNPNLYNCGKVCLSLLGTWAGPSWDPKSSTLLQVLVSIQALILVPDPYFNEPGYESSMSSAAGKKQSATYNKNIQKMTLQHAILGQLKACLSSPATDSPFIFREVILTHFAIKKRAIAEQLQDWGLQSDAMTIQLQGLMKSL